MERRHHAEASRGVRRGRLAPEKSAPCRFLGGASVAGLFGRRHQVPFGARDTFVSAGPVAAWQFGQVGDTGERTS